MGLNRDAIDRMNKDFIPSSNIRVTFIGRSKIGKHTLIRDYIQKHDYLGENYLNRPIVSRMTYTNASNQPIDLETDVVIDSIKFGTMTTRFKISNIICLVFDLTNKQSFDDLEEYWKRKVEFSQDARIVLIGTKRDCQESRVIERSVAQKYADLLSAQYYETSLNDTKYTLFHSIIKRVSNQFLFFYPHSTYFISLKSKLNLLNIKSSLNNSNNNNKNKNNQLNNESQILFFRIIKNSYLLNQIFKQITIIHSDLNISSRKLNSLNLNFWIRNQYYNILKYKSLNQQKQQINQQQANQQQFTLCFYNESIIEFQRNNQDLNLYKSLFNSNDFIKSMDKKQCTRIMDETCVGGSVDIITDLYLKGFRWSICGFFLAISFGNLKLVEFMLDDKQRPPADPKLVQESYRFIITQPILEKGIECAKLNDQKDIISLIRSHSKQSWLSKLNSK